MEEEFDVLSAHEHAVEHDVEARVPLTQKIALFSAILATLGAIVSFLGSHTQNDALYYKNEAVLVKARASDTWAYYQSEQLKQHLIREEVAIIHAPSPDLRSEIAKYERRAKLLKAKAERLDQESDAADAESRAALIPHTKLAMSMTFLQIAIALASITALTRRAWLIWAAIAAAAVGIVLGAIAWL